jgi:hypothetical protein
MKRKIIIPIDDFNDEVVLFLRAVGAGVPANWSAEALALVRLIFDSNFLEKL